MINLFIILSCIFSGMSPMDIAYAWADPRVIDIVQRKWDTLAPLDAKGKKGKKGGSGAPKENRPPTAAGGKPPTTAGGLDQVMDISVKVY